MFHSYQFETVDVAVFFTLILLEGILSFDNAAVLAAMVRKLPPEQRRKALLYGLGGAYVFRILAILSVAYIIQYPILKVVGGLYLLYLAVRHLAPISSHDRPSMWERIGFSGFWAVVISVELADVVFALDQVLVAVAMTEKIPLIIAASLIAIVFLRLSATYIGRLMDWFPPLEKLAYVAVGFVGLKLVGVEIIHHFWDPHFEVPKAISIGVTLSLLALPLLGKLVYERLRRRTAPDATE